MCIHRRLPKSHSEPDPQHIYLEIDRDVMCTSFYIIILKPFVGITVFIDNIQGWWVHHDSGPFHMCPRANSVVPIFIAYASWCSIKSCTATTMSFPLLSPTTTHQSMVLRGPGSKPRAPSTRRSEAFRGYTSRSAPAVLCGSACGVQAMPQKSGHPWLL